VGGGKPFRFQSSWGVKNRAQKGAFHKVTLAGMEIFELDMNMKVVTYIMFSMFFYNFFIVCGFPVTS
jgi:hypothetical protein